VHAEIRFYAELRDFLDAAHFSGEVGYDFVVPGSVKDAVEACGVPHTEVDLVVANGRSVGFDYRVADGDRISVYPVFESFDITGIVKVRPAPLREVRFVVAGNLERLAGYLRLLGFDTAHDHAATDHELVAISADQGRILLTRHVGLLKHRGVTHGYYVRATTARLQLIEVVRRFHLSNQAVPFSRCMRCNGLLGSVDKHEIADQLPPQTRETVNEFTRCSECDQVYWQGAHQARLDEIVAEARHADA
jgi:hypothetical protein